MAVTIPTTVNASGSPPLAGNVQLAGSGATSVSQAGNVITISSTGGGGGGSTALTEVEVDLGAVPVSNGTFIITSSGLVTGKLIQIHQSPGPYTGKGTLMDEIELDHIVITGKVTSATTIECHWGCATKVAGKVKFNYWVSA